MTNIKYAVLILLTVLTASCTKSTIPLEPSKPAANKPDNPSIPSNENNNQATRLVGFEAIFSPASKGLELWESETYDASGNIIKKQYREWANPEYAFNMLQIETFAYDAENKKISRQHDVLAPNDTKPYNIRNEVFLYSGKLIVENRSIDAAGVVYERNTFSYDDNNRIIKGANYLKDSGREYLNRNDTYTYDTRGNLIGVIGILPARASLDEGTETHTWEYDDHNNITKERYSGAYFTNNTFKRKYDSNNKVIELIQSDYTADGYLKFEITYNPNGTIKNKRVSKSSTENGTFSYIGDIIYTYTYK